MTQIYYAKLLDASQAALRKQLEVKPLTRPGATKVPMGVAADNARMALFVADPGSQVIVAFPLSINYGEGGKLVCGEAITVLSGCSAQWVAVDGKGNLFYTEGANNEIKTIPGVQLESLLSGAPTTIKPVSLYSAAGPPAVEGVAKPQGIAVDNFNLFWVNGESGTDVGTVMKGSEVPPDIGKEKLVKILSQNSGSAFGLCVSAMHLFYSDSSANFYGMRRSGGYSATITDKFQAPRGCSWDGDGTIYVADKDANAVFAFPGDTPSLSPRAIVKAFDVTDPYGLTTFSRAWRFSAVGSAVVATLLFHWF